MGAGTGCALALEVCARTAKPGLGLAEGGLGVSSRHGRILMSHMSQATRSPMSWSAESDRLGAIDELKVQLICINKTQVCSARPVVPSTH